MLGSCKVRSARVMRPFEKRIKQELRDCTGSSNKHLPHSETARWTRVWFNAGRRCGQFGGDKGHKHRRKRRENSRFLSGLDSDFAYRNRPESLHVTSSGSAGSVFSAQDSEAKEDAS